MTTASTRVLRLLSLLQGRREWSGSELSERLEVDVRTVRRDANRLRELGYVIESAAGPGGGYRLAAGAHTPPLLLDDEEVLTIALALGSAAGSLGNLTQAALGLLVKLDQLLPARLRRKWKSIADVTMTLPGHDAAVDPRLLTALAAACRDARRVRFNYGDREKRETSRDVEPMRLVHTGRVWYLAAWDIEREDWRTFRLDRIDVSIGVRLGPAYVPRSPPEDFATLVSRAISAAPYSHRARLRIPLPLEQARRRVPAWVGMLEPLDETHCVALLSANSHAALVALIVNAAVPFELIEPAELATSIRAVAERLLAGVAV